MNIFRRLGQELDTLFGDPPPPEPPAPRPEHSCGVRDCLEPQTIIRQDERETVVECPVHECVTSWETKPREERYLQVIRPSDTWRQHGVNPPPK